MLSEERAKEVMATQSQEGTVVTHMPNAVFETKPEGGNNPCLTHWRFEPQVVGGVPHCGNCGAITGSIGHLVKVWVKCREALGRK